MKTKSIFRKVCCVATFAVGAVLSLSAQDTAWLRYGQHVHDHPISEDLAHEYMAKYFGIAPKTEGGTDYDNTDSSCLVKPTDVDAGEAILVEVNPYWRGVFWYKGYDGQYFSTTSGEPVSAPNFEAVRYGVKAVHKVDPPVETPGGHFYSYTGKLGRFYFATRYISPRSNTSRTLGCWYKEWSFLTDILNIGWDNFVKYDHYSEFLDGVIWYAPHICYNTLENNHFASFIPAGQEDTFDGYKGTMLFYLSSHWDNIEHINGQLAGNWKPFMWMLRAFQEPTKVDKVAETGATKYYDITLTFKSTFMDATEAISEDGEVMWREGSTGVKEYFDIYRDGVKIATVPADELTIDTETGKYIWVDTNGGSHFTTTIVTGEDYVYDIVSKLYAVSADGSITDGNTATPIATAQTERRTAHIPGNENFVLAINGETQCTYAPSSTFGQGKNNFTHVIDIELVTDFVYQDGDVLQLRQFLGDDTNNIQTETLTGTGNISEIISREEEGKLNWQQVNYKFTMKGGQTKDATYQLVLMRKNIENQLQDLAYSNRLFLSAYRADLENGRYIHRQGHPSDENCPTDEVYHNEMKFTPSKDANIVYYYILRNGIDNQGDVITYQEYKDYDVYPHTAIYQDVLANTGEDEGFMENKDVFFTAVARDAKGNTYGSADLKFTFTGAPNELIYYANPSTSTTPPVTASASHNSIAFHPMMSLKLNCEMNKVGAADVDPADISSVKIMGLFKTASSSYDNPTYEERELVSFSSMTEDLTLNYETDINIKLDSRYSEEWADINVWNVADGYGPESDEAKLAWANAAPKFWQDNMPTKIYVEVTYDGSYFQSAAPANLPKDDLNGPNLAPSKAVAQEGEYKKYSNWAFVPMPTDWGNMMVTGIDEVAADNGLRVYPTMTSDYVTVSGYTGEIVLVNLNGNVVKKVYASGTATVDVSDLNKGIYLLKAGTTTEKVIVK